MYRNEVDALRARAEQLETELAEAKADNAVLARRIHELENPPAPAPRSPPPTLSLLLQSAYRAAIPLVAVTALGGLWAGGRFVGLAPAAESAPMVALAGVIAWLAALVVATAFAGRPIQRATGYDGAAMIFVTWFWLPFALLFPGLGSLFALARLVVLLRGRFMSATITSNGSSRHWPAIELHHREGWPAALVFACVLAIQPIVFGLV